MSGSFAFGCGRHSLTGTYQEQLAAFKEISEIRDTMRALGGFEGIEIKEEDRLNKDLSPRTKIWLAEMDMVWQAWCAD